MRSQEENSFFTEDQIRNFRLFHMTCFEARNVLHQIYQWGIEEKDPNETLDKFLHEKVGFSKVKIRNYFNSDQRQQLKKDPAGDTFDLSLLGQIIPLACKGLRRPWPWVLNFTEDRLGVLIQEIKNFRNTFIHLQPFNMDENTFSEKTDSLRKLLTETLEVAATLYDIEKEKCDKLVKTLHENIDKSSDDRIENWDITSLENNLLLIEKQILLLTEGKDQIIKKYKYFSQVSPASFLTGSNIHLRVGIVFTQMEIVKFGSSSEVSEIEYNEILEYAQNASIENGSKTDVLFIEGIAGAGKTTITKLMMSQWEEGISPMLHLLDYDFLIYFECRNSAIDSFTQLLESLMPQVISKFKEGDLRKCILTVKLLIIADGLDELNKSSKKVMQEILDLGNLTVVTIVCTSRPEYVENFYKMVPCGQHVTHIKIKGISRNKRIEFVMKYHDELRKAGLSKRDTKGLTDFLNSSIRQLEEHWRLPLNLVLLTIMWALTPDQMNEVTSATELYTEFTGLNKQRLVKRLMMHEKSCHFNHKELGEKVDRFFLHLSWEALITLKDKSIDSLPDESVERLSNACSTLDIPLEPVLSAFLVEDIIYTDARAKSVFSIAHKGLQDYLAANYIIQALNGNDLRFDITSIIKGIQSHPSFCNESLRLEFIHHIMKYLGTMLKADPTNIPAIVQDTSASSSTLPLPSALAIPENNYRPTTIQSVLEGLYGLNKVPSDLSRYQNTFAYTAGLLHLVPDIIRPNVANEIVNLFLQSGALDKDQWFDFITEMKCHDSVIKSIAALVPNLVSGIANISDERADIYAKLLPHGEPKCVRINMANNAAEIPSLEKLIMDLAKKGNCPVYIHLNYNFRNPVATSTELDSGLEKLFLSCEVKRFMGRLSETNAQFLPMTVERLAVIVDEGNASAMRHVFLNLAEKASQLNALSVHVTPGVTPESLFFLPGKGDLILFISDVTSDNISWACKVAKNLQPKGDRSMFNNIMFPRCHLNTEEFSDLLQEMTSHEVKISGDGIFGGLAVASHRIPEGDTQKLKDLTRDCLGCTFRLSAEEAIWPKIINTESSKSRRLDKTK